MKAFLVKYWPLFLLVTLLGTGAVAQSRTTADQGSPGKYGPWPVAIQQADGGFLTVNVAAGGGSVAYSPAVPATVSLSASTSGAVTGITAGSDIVISCGAAASFRTGTGTPVAVSTDNDLPAGTLLRFRLKSTETAVAFISSSATTCKTSVATQ